MNLVDNIVQNMMDKSLPSEYWSSDHIVFPELEDTKSLMQRNDQSVWEHTMSVIDLLSLKNPVTLLSGLFHDLGKCCTQQIDDLSVSRFPGHAMYSAQIVEITLKKWGASEYLIDRVSRLVAMHMYDISNAARDKTIRKFVAEVGRDNIDNWFVLRIADSRSYAEHQKYRNHFIEPFRRVVMAYLEKQPGVEEPSLTDSSAIGGVQIEGGDVSGS